MEYKVVFTPFFEKQLKKIKQKDVILFQRLNKKIKEIQQNPEHYKPLSNVLKEHRRVHIDPFVLIFSIQADMLVINYVKHHDDAY